MIFFCRKNCRFVCENILELNPMNWSHKPGWNEEGFQAFCVNPFQIKSKFFTRFTWSSSRSYDSQASVLSF